VNRDAPGESKRELRDVREDSRHHLVADRQSLDRDRLKVVDELDDDLDLLRMNDADDAPDRTVDEILCNQILD